MKMEAMLYSETLTTTYKIRLHEAITQTIEGGNCGIPSSQL
jgi:hypothetical protein